MNENMYTPQMPPNVETRGHHTAAIIDHLQSLVNHADDMRSQVQNVGDRMFGPGPVSDSGTPPVGTPAGSIDEIVQCLSVLGSRMNDLQSQIRRIETL